MGKARTITVRGLPASTEAKSLTDHPCAVICAMIGWQGGAAMTVKRIVADIETPDPALAEAFYGDVLGLAVIMDQGWIRTYGGEGAARIQISFMSTGGSDTPVPDLSIEVEDVDATHARALAAGFEIVYPMTDEPWGVRRFYVRDPFGKLINVLTHSG